MNRLNHILSIRSMKKEWTTLSRGIFTQHQFQFIKKSIFQRFHSNTISKVLIRNSSFSSDTLKHIWSKISKLTKLKDLWMRSVCFQHITNLKIQTWQKMTLFISYCIHCIVNTLNHRRCQIPIRIVNENFLLIILYIFMRTLTVQILLFFLQVEFFIDDANHLIVSVYHLLHQSLTTFGIQTVIFGLSSATSFFFLNLFNNN